MSFMIIFLAVGIALTLLFFLTLAARGQQSVPENIANSVNWSAIKDDELQSYLPHKKINAIKRYRELTNVGLKEAKESIEYVIANPDAKRTKGTSISESNTGGAGVRDLLLEGRFDAAVDLYAAFMGVDEFTARDAVTLMQRELDAESNLSKDIHSVHDLLAHGKKIQAIKQYRLLTGAGLADAKHAVEEMER